MKLKIIFISLLIIFVCSLSISSKTSTRFVTVIDSLSIPKDFLKKDTFKTDEGIYKQACILFQDSLVKCDMKLKLLLDSIHTLHNVLKKNNEKVRAFESESKQNDSIKLKLANCRLKERFTEKKNKEALRYLKSIVNKDIKEGKLYNNIYSLTSRYETDFKEIIGILKKAQLNSDKKNPFCSDFASDVINKLRQTSYYVDLYKKDWNIPYLNNLIDDAITILKKHDNDNIADFSKLI